MSASELAVLPYRDKSLTPDDKITVFANLNSDSNSDVNSYASSDANFSEASL